MTILKLDSSISGENSVSRVLTQSIVNQLVAANPDATVIERDLVARPLAHLTERGQDADVLDEFLGASTVVIGAPMYNFTVSSQLKAWIDRIVVAGKTFQYGPNGPEGLARDKRVIIALAKGGTYGEGSPTASLDHLGAYLRGLFNFIGVEPEFVSADGLGVSPEHRERSLAQALGETLRLAA